MHIAYSLPLRPQRVYRIALSTFFFIQGIVFASWASRIPDIKAKLQLSDAELGGLLFSLPAGQLAGMALSGYLVSRFGSRGVLMVAALLYPSSLLLLGLAPTTVMLSASLVIFGLCGNLINISANTQAVGVETLYRRSIMASFHGLWSLAGFIGGVIGGWMVTRGQGPFTHFCFIFSLSIVLAVVTGSFLLPRDAARKTGKTNIFVKPDRNIVLLGLITFACMICEGTMFEWTGVYFNQVVHAPVEYSRLGFIAFMTTMAGGRFAADYFVTRFGVKRMLRASGLIIVTGLMTAVLLPALLTATTGFLITGLGVAAVVPLSFSIAGKSKTIQPGVALAMVSSIGFFGFLLGPPLIGFIAEAFGLRVSFAVIAVLGLGTTLLAGRVKTDE
ncbi:MFS transporter [Chitinophaga sp. GCM10012297]|uniref:MFS transporter n=1 Tax=Chitinophaga chungangae TaxID=2821488 RepID=A0ABS3YBG2_9BACT|nr:MFS transporter [Chitinophaga chungangae]MBO9151991.1 MFS transporter [Chitinophaga chungangae]